jgi:hypothetical protein
VRRWTVFWIAALITGCGDGEEQPQATATATATPHAVKPARTAEQCRDLWNSNAYGGSAGQKAPEDYLAEVAPTGAAVEFVNGDCLVIAPVKAGSRRIYIWVARGGRAPYGHPSQDTVPAGRDLRVNAQATEEGKLE